MASPHLPTLIQIAQQEIPSLQYDIQNASTLFTLQDACKRMHNIVTYLVHHAILESLDRSPAAAAPRPAPTPPPPPPVAPPNPHGLPLISMSSIGGGVSLPSVGGTSPQVHASSVTEVLMTPQGTQVIPPGGRNPVSVAPPGIAVDATFGQPRSNIPPLFPQAIPTSEEDVFLAQGGNMTPEVAAALSARTAAPGAARNITSENP